jgi:hypothetical protein
VRRSLLAVLPAWFTSRAVVLATLELARRFVSQLHPTNPSAALRAHEGLLAWDAGWYQTLARGGYAAGGTQSLRFFPGFPLLARALADLPGVSTGAALVVIANVATLVGLAVVHRLVVTDLGDEAMAGRTVWLLVLGPAAYVLVMGYSEGLFLLCTATGLLAVRQGRWWLAAGAGFVAGTVRPLGVLLVVPFLVEGARPYAARWWATEPAFARAVHDVRQRHSRAASAGQGPAAAGQRLATAGAASSGSPLPSVRSLAVRVVAGAAPLAGIGAYLGWVGATYGNALLPFEVQTQGGHRGPLTQPFTSMLHNAAAFLHGHHVGSALHIPWVLLALVLLVVAARRLPASYSLFAAAMLVVSLSSTNLDSFERYALSAFPLVIAGAAVTTRPEVWRVVLVGAAAALVGYGLLAFLGIVVP